MENILLRLGATDLVFPSAVRMGQAIRTKRQASGN